MSKMKTTDQTNTLSDRKRENKTLRLLVLLISGPILLAAILIPLILFTAPAWLVGKQRILYDVAGETVQAEVTFGKTFRLAAPTRPGYTFEGLYADADLTEQIVGRDGNSIGKYRSLEKDAALYVNWAERPYSEVTYLVKGEEVSFETTRLHEGPGVCLSVATGNSEEIFLYWECDGEQITDETGRLTEEWEKKERERVTLNAVFTPICNITYDLEGGSAKGLVEHYSLLSEAFTLPMPTRVGYDFVGWSGTEIVGRKKTVTIPKGKKGDRAYKAAWKPISYTITYDLDGGKNDTTNLENYTIESDTMLLAEPTKLGYDFVKWTDENGKTITSISNGSVGNRKITANWSPVLYAITYDLDGGKNNTNNPSSYTVKDSISLAAPTRKGYTFIGWSGTDISGTTKSVSFNSQTGARDYKANWELTTYTITYKLDGGTNASTNLENYTITSDAILLAEPTMFGYDFVKWTDENGNIITSIPKGSVNNKTIKANWRAKPYSITYDLDGGENNANNPSSYTIKDSISLAAPTRKGYEFVGWSGTGISGTTKSVSFNSQTGTRTYRANWEPIWSKITVSMKRYRCKVDNGYDKSNSGDNGWHHSGYEMGELCLYGCKKNDTLFNITSIDDFSIKWYATHNSNPIDNSVSDYQLISDDSLNKVYGTNINKKIGHGASWIRVSYNDDTQDQFVKTDLLKDINKGNYLELLSTKDIRKNKQVKNIEVVIAYEIYCYGYDAVWGWTGIPWKQWSNWRLEYTFAF